MSGFDPSAAARELRPRFSGALVTPGDDGYDDARAVWNGTIDRHPAVVARCATVDDVVASIEVARRHGLAVAVRGGGHNVAGLATCEDGIVIDLSAMNDVRVDPARRLAFVQGGARWQDVDAATQVHGLAAPAGLVSETGVGGLTLGGGMGWLRRKYGLTCDNLVGAEVVTAAGRRVTVSEQENADLLWALRGGGGNFGVVTTFIFRLHPVGPEVAYSLVFYDGAHTAQGLRALRAYSAVAPDEVSPIAFTGVVPAMEGVTPELAGRPMLAAGAVYAGPPEAGDEALRPMRELTEPFVDLSGRMPYVELQRFLDEEYPNGRRYYWKSAVVDELSDAVIDVVVASAARQPSPLSTIDVWVMGGATAREPAGGSAYAGRDAGFMVNPEADWDDPADDAANLAWAREFIAAMRPFTVGTYLNFPGMLEEGEDQLRSGFGDHYERLVAVKDAWDPTNVFRLNHNVVPSARGRAA
ncbi:MAG TPA: FAD-binding oxidoreductase [Thermoleophilia bacterium]|nr:FAD-binding oxidoreductase [Thermoleophilia bacterium]